MSMRERLAKAIFEGGNRERSPAESWDELPLDWSGAFLAVADVALAAMREPTEEMCSAGIEARECEAKSMDDVWRAMIDAASSPNSPTRY